MDDPLRMMIFSPEDMLSSIEACGVLPFSSGPVPGMSVEELSAPGAIWSAFDSPWEWKGDAVRSRTCMYGKLFHNKAGFVHRGLIPDFLNYRRDGYDFDAACDEGLMDYRLIRIHDAVAASPGISAMELRAKLGMKAGTFDGLIAKLQMRGYVMASDIPYRIDRRGRRYGWGYFAYATPEEVFGYDLVSSAYRRDPAESLEHMVLEVCRRLGREDDGTKTVIRKLLM